MEATYILETAETIRRQLVAGSPTNVILSWGPEQFVATTLKGMAALKFKVNGRLHKGYVVIAYNEADYYEIYLMDMDKNIVKCVSDEVYCDELSDVIDTAIERGYDDEEYMKFCEKAFSELFFR